MDAIASFFLVMLHRNVCLLKTSVSQDCCQERSYKVCFKKHNHPMQCDMQNFRRLGKINYSYIKSKFNLRLYFRFLSKCAFLWGDLDQWSKVTRVIVDQRNRWIHSDEGFIGSFDALWSKWSWITDPALDHPKECTLSMYIFRIFILPPYFYPWVLQWWVYPNMQDFTLWRYGCEGAWRNKQCIIAWFRSFKTCRYVYTCMHYCSF